jgi:hypothetical protein
MFRLALHPTRLDLAFGLMVIALWALLWIWFLAGLEGPRSDTRQPGEIPELARAHREDVRRARA